MRSANPYLVNSFEFLTRRHGLECGVGRGLGMGVALGVGLGVAVGVGVGLAWQLCNQLPAFATTFPPISALHSYTSDVGRNTNCSLRNHRSGRYQGLAEVVLRDLCRRRIRRYDVPEDAVEGGDMSHDRVASVKRT
jgi:hypothetical protein